MRILQKNYTYLCQNNFSILTISFDFLSSFSDSRGRLSLRFLCDFCHRYGRARGLIILGRGGACSSRVFGFNRSSRVAEDVDHYTTTFFCSTAHNKNPPYGGYFSFGHSPNTTGCAQVRFRLAYQPCNCCLLPVNGFIINFIQHCRDRRPRLSVLE